MTPRQYAAFISYSHSDEDTASRLHKAIEAYRTPRQLRGQESRDGRVPTRLVPVFRDREELPTSSDLGLAIRTALENARYLVVLCSRRAAVSRWVNEEILQFKRHHGEGRIIAVILDGEPGSVDDECFPPALSRRIGVDGEPTDEPTEPVAADLRPGKDGWRRAKMKVLAGLLAVNLDDLVQRERQRRRRSQTGLAAALSALAAAGGWAAVEWNHRATLEQARTLAARGVAEVRGGDLPGGTGRLLSAVRMAGPGNLPEVGQLISALTRRLVPLAEAMAGGDATVVSWREGTYLLQQETAPRRLPVSQASVFAWTSDGSRLVVGGRGAQLQAFDATGGTALWSVSFEGVTEICGIWETPADRLYVEGAYRGATIGADYGVAGLVDARTGEGDLQPTGMVGPTVCTGSPTPDPGIDVARGARHISADVLPFAWPAVVAEHTLWTPVSAPPLAPFLDPEETASLNATWHFGGDREWARDIDAAFACGEQPFVVGVSSFGMGGGTWQLCQARGGSDLACTAHGYVGDLRGFAVSSDCEMTVAYGGGIDEWRGLVAVDAAGAQLEIGNLPEVAIVDAARFSPSASRFAATDGGSRMLVFNRDGPDLNLVATHDLQDRILAWTFLGEDRLAVVTDRNVMRGLDAVSGADLWPGIAIGNEMATAFRGNSKDDGMALMATASGSHAVLAASLPADTVFMLDPALRPTAVDGSEHQAEPEEFAAFAWLVDAVHGVPLGRRMSLTWVIGPERLPEKYWQRAALQEEDDAIYLRLDDTHALRHELAPMSEGELAAATTGAESLTGVEAGSAAPLTVLPGAIPAR